MNKDRKFRLVIGVFLPVVLGYTIASLYHFFDQGLLPTFEGFVYFFAVVFIPATVHSIILEFFINSKISNDFLAILTSGILWFSFAYLILYDYWLFNVYFWSSIAFICGLISTSYLRVQKAKSVT